MAYLGIDLGTTGVRALLIDRAGQVVSNQDPVKDAAAYAVLPLVVGAGAGYGAAVLAACGGQVTALEEDEALLAIARTVLPGLAPGVRIQAGPLPAGWPAGAPYDVVMIEGAVRAIPDSIAPQLRADGGRLVTVLADRPGAGQGVLAEHSGPGQLRAQPVFDCATPLLPAFAARPAFQF